jgi:hypothetical protein
LRASRITHALELRNRRRDEERAGGERRENGNGEYTLHGCKLILRGGRMAAPAQGGLLVGTLHGDFATGPSVLQALTSQNCSV